MLLSRFGAIYIIENDNGAFKPTSIQQGYGGSGISMFDLSNPLDRIIPYDYADSGSQDHLLCYRPGTGLVYILQNTNGAFSPVYPPNGSGTLPDGIGGYMLDNPDACIIAYDYSSSGDEDYLFCYRTAGNASIITVTVQNYANVAVAVVQNKQVLVTLPPAPSSTQPSSAQIQVDSTAEVLLQEPGNWYAVPLGTSWHINKFLWTHHLDLSSAKSGCAGIAAAYESSTSAWDNLQCIHASELASLAVAWEQPIGTAPDLSSCRYCKSGSAIESCR